MLRIRLRFEDCHGSREDFNSKEFRQTGHTHGLPNGFGSPEVARTDPRAICMVGQWV